MTFGLRERSAREKAAALNSGIPTEKKNGRVPKLAARAFAISAIRETFPPERPMIAIRKEPGAT
jgi:hypothetical protein